MDPNAPRQGVPARPAHAPAQPVARPVQHQQPKKKKPAVKKIVGGIILLALLTAIIFGALHLFGGNGEQRAIESDKYQAVFLTNGQVYFGKINTVDKDHISIEDIFYLQQQSQEPQEQQDPATVNDSTNTSLAKLGGELHGPEDAMYITKEQVLFWENLKTDGKVTQAIAEYKKQ